MRQPFFFLKTTAVLALTLIGLGSCGEPRPAAAPANGLDPLPADANSRDAETTINDLDRALDSARALPPAIALERQRALGPRVDQAVVRCAGTRFENKAVYIQAQWRFNFDDAGNRVDAALDRLDGLEKPILKQAGRALRVQHQLREGRLITARSKAEQLIGDVPEFGFLLDLVRWHERIGGTIEISGGLDLDGVLVDPATAEEGHVLFLLLAVWNDQAAFTVQRYRSALASLNKPDCRLVLVIGDGAPRRIRDDLHEQPAASSSDVPLTVILARSVDEARSLNETWKPPFDGFTVMLGPKRRITGVALRPGDLAEAMRK